MLTTPLLSFRSTSLFIGTHKEKAEAILFVFLKEIKEIEALNAVGAASILDLDELEDCKRILNVCGAVVQFLHELEKGGVDNA